ncbi:mycofactocin-coupled SDR family oxidoreductase [Maricaulis salignorans]|uniref:SDR family mycofactocin-dependent oxidoreductase n=1 Tax=Maricaulis salignorans TaxID=144026 RepID=A0A1G9LRQ7_9PROT|nr:mycofactocin-coupled SDR family oxidoreductase [Maricaulis salignorans]SDL64441.1 SDR family mycofactocin-dependent oxidoreductase [Maricaulis salignorans]
MTRRFDGKVVFVTGAARGQGRATAEAFAREGACIIAADICRPIASDSPGAAPDDMTAMVDAIEGQGGRVLARQCDVRDLASIEAVLDEGVAAFGGLDIVSAQAGIAGFGKSHELSEDQWSTMIDINLSGVWRTCRAAIPHLVAGESGGSIILTSSAMGLKALPDVSHYVAAKHGVVGLMRALALELGHHSIRVNAVCTTTVNTPLIQNPSHLRKFRPDLENPTLDDAAKSARRMNVLPVPWVEVDDVRNAILWLCSDEARYITGVALPVDAGFLIK